MMEAENTPGNEDFVCKHCQKNGGWLDTHNICELDYINNYRSTECKCDNIGHSWNVKVDYEKPVSDEDYEDYTSVIKKLPQEHLVHHADKNRIDVVAKVLVDHYNFVTAKESENVDNSQFDRLQEGSCEIFLRALPPGKGTEVTFDNFETYDPTNTEETGIHTNVDIDGGIVKKRFVVKNPPKDKNEYRVEIVQPGSSGVFCVDDKKKEVDLKYIFQSSNNKFEKDRNPTLIYSVTADGRRLDDSLHNVQIPYDKLVTNNIGKDTIDLSKDYDSLKDKGRVAMSIKYKLEVDGKEEQREIANTFGVNFATDCGTNTESSPPATISTSPNPSPDPIDDE